MVIETIPDTQTAQQQITIDNKTNRPILVHKQEIILDTQTVLETQTTEDTTDQIQETTPKEGIPIGIVLTKDRILATIDPTQIKETILDQELDQVTTIQETAERTTTIAQITIKDNLEATSTVLQEEAVVALVVAGPVVVLAVVDLVADAVQDNASCFQHI